MPTKISSKEILEYLNGLGYNNVSAQQLKDFMQDLKKLIKYEENRRSRDHSDASSSSTVSDEADYQPPIDIFTTLHKKGTVESNAKIVPKKESVICVQIKRPKSTCSGDHCNKETVPAKAKEENNQPVKEVPITENKENIPKKVDVKASSNKSIKTNQSKVSTKPKVSFIRSTFTTNHKSDPVALYHKYQAEWKRQKIPGTDNRADLRWAIREKMLGGR